MRLREIRLTYHALPGTTDGRAQIGTAADAARIIAPLIDAEPIEVFGVLSLDTKNRIIGWQVISRGTLDSCLVHPREVYKAAIIANAFGIIVAHNHPSGDPTPSTDDDQIARRLRAAGELLGITLLDALVIGHGGTWTSAQGRGVLTA